MIESPTSPAPIDYMGGLVPNIWKAGQALACVSKGGLGLHMTQPSHEHPYPFLHVQAVNFPAYTRKSLEGSITSGW